MNVIFQVPEPEDHRKKSWAKHIKSVDTSQRTGYAFHGPWLRRGERAELPVGSLVLLYDQPGSRKNWWPLVRVMRVEADGSLTEVLRYEGKVRELSWALAVRDNIKELLDTTVGNLYDPRVLDLLVEADKLGREP